MEKPHVSSSRESRFMPLPLLLAYNFLIWGSLAVQPVQCRRVSLLRHLAAPAFLQARLVFSLWLESLGTHL